MLQRFEGYEGNQKDKRSKISFKSTNNEDILVYCCGAIFNKNLDNPKFEDGEDFRVSIMSKKKEKERVRVIKNNE